MAGEGRFRTAGIHHVTAIAGDPQRNLDFYTQVLGLRMVKRTVNFDDPGSYHFYFGDEVGTPGTILTFFAWPGAPQGHPGVGQATAVSFRVPAGSLGFWAERLKRYEVTASAAEDPLAGETIGLADPDGLPLRLVEAAAGAPGYSGAGVPAEHAVRGFAGVTLWERTRAATERVLTEMLGLGVAAEEGDAVRYASAAGDGPGGGLDLVVQRDTGSGLIAAGTVHHVAFRATSDEEQRAWRAELAAGGFHVTQVLDRCYFRSIYFREPGGVLFEIATDGPGFAVDEPAGELGRSLKLPSWLEPRRPQLEASLPPVELRSGPPPRP